MKKTILALSLAACAAASLAKADGLVPSVSGVTMAQTAHSRTVTIAYTLADAAAYVTLDIQTNATDTADGAWVSLGGANVCNATGDVWKKVATGSHTITWRADKSWRGFKLSNARAVVTAWSVDNPPPYLVVDLSETGGAGTERHYPSVEFLPGGLLTNPDYRTSKIVMRKIPAADVTWTMGSASTEKGRSSAKEALHAVTFESNYYLGVFEVTQAQWSLVQTARPTPSYYTVSREMRPVEMIAYNEIRNAANSTTADTAYYWPKGPNPGSFLGLLRTKTGLLFDLPSEAQWEFACRAGQGSGVWNDGSPIVNSDDDANLYRLGRYGYNGGKIRQDDGTFATPAADCDVTNGTAIAGSYEPNAWGLYDMHGNVWEWCLDWYEADITARGGAVNVDPDNPANTLSGAAGTKRVRRGGSWGYGAGGCRAAGREAYAASDRSISAHGFRLALPIPSAAE